MGSLIPLDMFEFLDDTHKSIQVKLQDLRVLLESAEFPDFSRQQKHELESIYTFFAIDAHQHHLDEEQHVFPALLASQSAELLHLAKQLRQDHGWLEENWIELAPQLQALLHSNGWADKAELTHAFDVFEALYTEHMSLEESIAFPKAKEVGQNWDPLTIGREMAKRRMLKPAVIRL